MRRAKGPDGVRLFKVSEFLTPQQCTSYFSRLAAKVRRQTSDDAEIQAVVEEENFTMARETILSITLQHPITYDQHDICAMAKGGSLEWRKLRMFPKICQQLELEVPPKPVRRKALDVDLLKKTVINFTCQLCGQNMKKQKVLTCSQTFFSFGNLVRAKISDCSWERAERAFFLYVHSKISKMKRVCEQASKVHKL